MCVDVCVYQHNYDRWFTEAVYNQSVMKSLGDIEQLQQQQAGGADALTSLRVEYSDLKSFKLAAKKLSLLDDCRVSRQ